MQVQRGVSGCYAIYRMYKKSPSHTYVYIHGYKLIAINVFYSTRCLRDLTFERSIYNIPNLTSLYPDKLYLESMIHTSRRCAQVENN